MSQRYVVRASRWRPFASGLRPDRWWLPVLIVAVILPNALWIVIDQTAWPWDQALYGRNSIELFSTLYHAPSEWIPAMLRAFGRQAPGIAWLGQFFVPVGLLTGSIDSGLLASILGVQIVALGLMARAIGEFSGGRLSVAGAGLIIMASAPLFIALSHRYLVEMLQTAAVAWFIFIMARAPKWSRLLIACQLALATTLAMLAKVSSPLFCFGPGLVALYYLIRPGQQADADTRVRTATTLAFAIPLGALTAAWYYLNIQDVVAHVSMAASGPVAELYGKSERFLPSLSFWLSAVHLNFFSPLTTVLAGGLVSGAVIATLWARDGREKAWLLAAGVSAVQILAGLAVFSLSSNRDDRYLLPLLPYFVLILCWAVARMNRPLVTVMVITAFAIQWSYAHAQALGLMPLSPGAPWLHSVMTNERDRSILDALVRRTCAEPSAGRYWNAVGVQLMWLNPPGVSYAAAKRFAPRHSLPCDYEAIAYYDTDEDEAWRRLMSRDIKYYIGLDATAYTTPTTPADKTVNALNEPILRRVEKSGLFQLEKGIAEHDGILILRRVDRINHLTNGRALSDRGRHQKAVEELTTAATLDPGNVEAWANLALAHEREGNMPRAIAAGLEARRLNPTHYYVNLGLARAFAGQHQWAEAMARAEDAARDAPGTPERVAALIIAARSAFAAANPAQGCTLLGRANALQESRDTLDALTTHGCGKW